MMNRHQTPLLRRVALVLLLTWQSLPCASAAGLHTKASDGDVSPAFEDSLELISEVNGASATVVADVYAELIAHPQFERMPGRHRNAVLTRAGEAAGYAGRYQ